jgi:hypothetical protein
MLHPTISFGVRKLCLRLLRQAQYKAKAELLDSKASFLCAEIRRLKPTAAEKQHDINGGGNAFPSNIN